MIIDFFSQKLLSLMLAMCVMAHASREQEDKMIKLEDIERDTLIHETVRSAPAEQKELTQPQTQHVQVSYSHQPQEVFVTPMPGRYAQQRGKNQNIFNSDHNLIRIRKQLLFRVTGGAENSALSSSKGSRS